MEYPDKKTRGCSSEHPPVSNDLSFRLKRRGRNQTSMKLAEHRSARARAFAQRAVRLICYQSGLLYDRR